MSCIHMKNLETDDLLENLTHKQMERIKRIICSSLCGGKCKEEYMERTYHQSAPKVLPRYNTIIEVLAIHNGKYSVAYTPIYGLVRIGDDHISKITGSTGSLIFGNDDNKIIVKYMYENCLSFDSNKVLSRVLSCDEIYKKLMED